MTIHTPGRSDPVGAEATKAWPRVGLVGAGRIARTGHLPAYAAGGVPLVAVCSATRTSARDLATAWPGDRLRVHATAAELAADPDVDLIDITTPPTGRAELIASLLPYGKPLLVQKPLAYTLKEATAITNKASAAGVPIAVNQNLRWAPPQRVLNEWITAGDLGEIAHIAHVHHFGEDERTWYTDHSDYLFIDHGLHYLDLIRWHTGRDPIAVAARAIHLPGQSALCPLTYTIMLRFGGPPLVASLTLYDAARSAAAWASNWFVNGTEADAHVTYTTATLHTATGKTISRTPHGEWVPDGILAAYTAFADALAADRLPPHHAGDHLRTLAMAEAAATSARSDGTWIDVPPPDVPQRSEGDHQR
ncbi:Predicted dehydrogenase [Streptosporangium canum]|uniref:Predicted dehydrogenase n=1 Tax=Streptosporangium canum TaxID=324952 RepID=A0A1I4FSQ7_9ACTN|nr:Gfo/Idh/MocA family oxidoreductase [Streptosporangium canum]SFL20888.1 Predicted dehydrogenase [Streptosporangium canum]